MVHVQETHLETALAKVPMSVRYFAKLMSYRNGQSIIYLKPSNYQVSFVQPPRVLPLLLLLLVPLIMFKIHICVSLYVNVKVF